MHKRSSIYAGCTALPSYIFILAKDSGAMCSGTMSCIGVQVHATKRMSRGIQEMKLDITPAIFSMTKIINQIQKTWKNFICSALLVTTLHGVCPMMQAQAREDEFQAYTGVILPALKSYLLQCGGDWILWQNLDSPHISKDTLKHLYINGWDHIESYTKLPDFSIMETWVSPLRRKFFCTEMYVYRQGH
jgi:hypothetical protein